MKLPERWGSFHGIEGLPLIIVASNGLVYLFEMVKPGLTPFLTLLPPALYAGELWRLATFLFVPPAASPIFMLFWLYLLYVYADALEREWGAFRFTGYYAVGVFATAAVGFFPAWGAVPNVFLNASLFLAFAALFPDFELLLFFILPLKVKYIGYFTWVMLVWAFLSGGWQTRLAVLAGLVNFFLFFGPDSWSGLRLRWQVYQNRRRWTGKRGTDDSRFREVSREDKLL